MAIKRQTSVIEQISSYSVVLLLLITSLLLLSRQSRFDLSRLGLSGTAETETEPNDDAPFDLSSVIPSNWKFLGGMEQYDSEALYEKINGKAPLYLDSGFSRLYTQKIVSSANEEEWAELYLYDMGNSENAFSVFSVQRRSGAAGIDGITTGYATENAVFAAIDKFYLEVIGSKASDDILSVAKSAVLTISKAATVESPTKDPFSMLFPAESVLADSKSLIKADAFGFGPFKNTYVAKYAINGEELTAFAMICDNREQAAQLAGSYRQLLLDNGFQQAKGSGQASDLIYEFDGVFELVFSRGHLLGGIHEASNREAAEQLLTRVAEHFERSLPDGGK